MEVKGGSVRSHERLLGAVERLESEASAHLVREQK